MTDATIVYAVLAVMLLLFMGASVLLVPVFWSF